MIHYKKTQYSKWMLILVGVLIFIIYSYFFKKGLANLPLIPFILILSILVIILALFYKLTLIIDDEKFTAIFGIGWLKKSVLISNIDLSTIEKVTFPWYVGIGIRLTDKGWLWNTKVGESIYFKSKNKFHSYLFGTDDFEEIKKQLLNYKKP
ncbi:MAG: hypothetical protein V3U80_00520 [Flavobacteriaceae bacterium]